MEAVTAVSSHEPDVAATAGVSMPSSRSTQTLAVKANYLLSEDGRKASLLAGGDGRAVQELAFDVPANRLHLVSVDANGVARLRLRPRYQLADERVVRLDSLPTYDAPPDIEQLFREAARNVQLERTFLTERRAERTRRQDADRDRRVKIGQA